MSRYNFFKMKKNTRNTKAQTLILDSIKTSKKAVSHDFLHGQLQQEIDRATIYRVLNRFSEDGIVHKIIGDDGKQYFAYCINCSEKKHKHQHFHFRCLRCDTVECLKQEIKVKLPPGYTADNFNGFISGYCANCTTALETALI